MDEFQWIEGVIAVDSVLRAGSRTISTVLVSQDRFDAVVARIQQTAQAQGIPVERVSAEAIGGHIHGAGHGGVIAQVGPRRLASLDDLLSVEASIVVMLDGVEDPFNFGQAVRCLYAAGIDGLVLRPRNWLSAAATSIRASAGATEFMPTAAAETLDVIAAARSRNIPIAVATVENARPMYEVDLTGPLLLMIGGEKRGVGRAAESAADLRISIPYGRAFPYSLGTAGASAALAFEILRQRLSR